MALDNIGGAPEMGGSIDNLKLYTSEKAVLRALQVTTIDGFVDIDLDKAMGIVEIPRPTLFRLKYVQRELRRQKGITSPLARRSFN